MRNLHDNLEQREADNLYRRRRITNSPQCVEMQIDGRDVISFCSNDYLGFANHPEVKQAFIEGANTYGVGSGAAHLVNGHSLAHEQLEQALAEFTGQQRALLFSTGYMANLGIAQALAAKGDVVLEDRLNHASLLDAGLLSGARFARFQHKDMGDLSAKLQGTAAANKLVMSDGVFSMDGDIAPVQQLDELCQQHDAMLVIDDAHGFGTLGKQGRGSLAHTGVTQSANTIYMATLGKALGTAGAFVAASEDIIETLIQQARTYIYTTASPPALACATLKSLELLQTDNSYTESLQDNIRYFRQCCREQEIPLSESGTAIQPVITGSSSKALQASESLLEKGLLVTAIRPPTVPQGTARLRITLCADHRRVHIDSLVDALGEIILCESS